MAAPPKQASRKAGPFHNVERLGPHGAQAAAKLGQAHDVLVLRGAESDALRLMSIDQAAERRDFAALDRMAAGEQPLSELTTIEHRGARRTIGWRNAVALVPLIATWAFLGWASLFYQHQLRERPQLSTEPFLVLWQQRFGGEIIPTFAETALTAFGLLVLVLLLTIQAHRKEGLADAAVAEVSATVDEAMESLALAVQTSTVRPPETAREWAEAAQRVLSETQEMIATTARTTQEMMATTARTTQEMIAAAVTGTNELAARNNEIAAAAQDAVAQLHAQGRDLVAALTRELQETVVTVRRDNEQFISRTTTEATAVLQQAVTSNQELLDHQLTPLFAGFHQSLEEYRADQRTYRTSAESMAQAVVDLTESARVLAGSSESYTKIASSIDDHLQQIQSSQDDFVSRVTENSQSMTTSATAMREVTTLIAGDLRGDLAQLATNVVDASTRLAEVDRGLTVASGAIQASATALQTAAEQMERARAQRAESAARQAAATGAAAEPGGRWWRGRR